MKIDNINPGTGYIVKMKSSNPMHFTEDKKPSLDDNVSGSFAEAFNNAMGKVNNLQIESEELNRKMVFEPESVDIHSVMIAAQKADIALSFTKAIRDEALKTYRELMNLR